MKHDLVDYEIDVLRICAGRPPKTEMHWGAAMGVAVECLRGRGFAVLQSSSRGGYEWVATDKGRELIEHIDGTKP